jgi:hypothetical protein
MGETALSHIQAVRKIPACVSFSGRKDLRTLLQPMVTTIASAVPNTQPCVWSTPGHERLAAGGSFSVSDPSLTRVTGQES